MGRKMKKFMLFVVLVFTLVSSIYAQQRRPGGGRNGVATGVVTGKVLDAETLQPIEYANIILKHKRDSTIVTGGVSQQDGTFKVEQVRPGRYSLEIDFLGYESHKIDDVRIGRDSPIIDIGEIILKPAAVNLNAVEVEGQKAPITYQIDKKVINVEEQMTVTSGSAIEVLENVPSIRVDIEGNVSLRGSTSFRLLIDGRPSILDPSDALQQIPASSIATIEIITNPSAKYDPEGTTGIINIIMKKGKGGGTSGVFSMDAGWNDKYATDGTFEYKTDKYSVVIGGNYRDRTFEGNEIERSQTTFNNSTTFVNTTGTNERGFSGWGVTGGIDYYPNVRNQFGISFRVGDFSHNRGSVQDYEEWTSQNPTRVVSLSEAQRERAGNYYSLNSNYKHRFTGKNHEFNAILSWRYRDFDAISTDVLKSGGSITEARKTVETSPGGELTLRLEYQRPIQENGRFETGYHYEMDDDEERNDFFELNTSTNEYELNPTFGNISDYTREIHAVYGLFANEWGNFGYQLGLRGELTLRNITSNKSATPFKIDRWDYFPTIHTSYKLSGGQQFMLSYTRRINRPRGWWLEPFITWVDAYTVRSGNPELLPEYVNSFDLGYQMFIGKSLFSIESYYRKSENKIERVRSVYQENVFLHTMANVGYDEAFGSEMFMNVDVAKFWNVNLMGDIYQYRVKGALFDDVFDRESFIWGGRMSNSIKVTDNFRLQIDGNYRSKSVTSQGEEQGFVSFNGAMRYDLLQKRLTATLQIRDIFDSSSRETVRSGTNFYQYNYSSREAPVVMFNLRYNFNNYRQERRERQSGDMMPADDF
jgi:hypothetical protein